MSIDNPSYKRRAKRRSTAGDAERARRIAHLSWTTKRIHVHYTWDAFCTRQVFHQHFASIHEYKTWWACFHDKVTIRRETWPRQWARTSAYHLNENDLGAKTT